MKLFNLWIPLQVWCSLAPLTVAEAPEPNLSATPSLDLSPTQAPDPSLDQLPSQDADQSPSPNPAPVAQSVPSDLIPHAVSDLMPHAASFWLPLVPLAMQWIGSIGGLLGVISFTDSYIRKLIDAFTGASSGPSRPPAKHDKAWFRHFEEYHRKFETGWKPRVAPDRKGDPSWKVGIQVGLDGGGLKGAGGEFPQICLWNMHGQLVGYNDQTIHIVDYKFEKHNQFNSEDTREDMPEILNGGFKTLGIWPAPGLEDRRDQQAIYVTMIKRHFDAICVSSVWVESHGQDKWLLDGSWGRASNMSWYYSYIFESGREAGECFWLDHRGDLKHKKDLEEDYIGNIVKELSHRKKEYPKWLWAANVLPEAGLPEGDELTDGMEENGVHEYRVPLGVKFHAPQFCAGKYSQNFNNLTVADFVNEPARLHWITEPSRRNVRGGNPLFPILHHRAKLTDKNPAVIWEDAEQQNIPVDCLTDWYYDENDHLVEPGEGDRCVFVHSEPFQAQLEKCRDRNFIDKYLPQKRSIDDNHVSDQPPPRLHEQHARTLVNDKNPRGGSGTKQLCEDPNSVGPSYANHKERYFCRMTDKTLWPFCDNEAGVSHDCFDAEVEILVEKNKPRAKRSHHWDIIEDWNSGEKLKRAA